MDSDLKLVDRKERKFPFQGASLLVLSLLLVGCVGGLIYVSINGQQKTCQQQQEQRKDRADMHANINMKSKNLEKQEDIMYDQTSKVAYYHGADGSFEVDDFSKGLHIIRAPGTKVCYVIPVGTKDDSDHGFEALLQEKNGGQIEVNETTEVHFEVLPGQIEDVSFIPEGAHAQCTRGYKWMVITEVTNANGALERQKRQSSTPCPKYCFIYRSRSTGRYHELCILELPNLRAQIGLCPTIYPENNKPQGLAQLLRG